MKKLLFLIIPIILFSCNQKKEVEQASNEISSLEPDRVSVFADPAIIKLEVLSTTGNPVDTNNLILNEVYSLKLTYANNGVNEVPTKTAYISIGLGMGLIIEPPLTANDEFLKYYYRKLSGKQGQLSATIEINPLPEGYSGTATFKVKATQLGSSTASSNFLVYNQNPGFILADTKVNNSASVSYIVK